MSGPTLPKDEKRAVKEIKKLIDGLPLASEGWDWSNVRMTETPILAEDVDVHGSAVLDTLEGKINTERMGKDLPVIQGKAGNRPIAVASTASELILACGGVAGACVNKDAIIIPTSDATSELRVAITKLSKQSSALSTQHGIDLLSLFGMSTADLADKKTRTIYDRSVVLHELTHASESMLDPRRKDLFFKPEYSAYRVQANYISAKLNKPHVPDGEILKFIGTNYGLGRAYIRSVLTCFGEDRDKSAPWMPGGVEFQKLLDKTRESLGSFARDTSIPEEYRAIYRTQLRQLEEKSFVDSDIGKEFASGAVDHLLARAYVKANRSNPPIDVRSEPFLYKALEAARSEARALYPNLFPLSNQKK